MLGERQLYFGDPEGEHEPRPIYVVITHSSVTHFQKSEFYQGRLDDGQEVTLKFSSVPEGVKREYEGLILANRAGVRSPKAFGMVEREAEPSTSVLMETIHGESLNHVMGPKTKYMQDLGTELAKLHQIDLPGFGFHTDGVPLHLAYEQHAEKLTADASNHFYGSTEGLNLLYELHARITTRPEPIKPKFIHGDVNDSNIMIDENDDGVVLIDFEFYKGAEPLEDIGMYNYVLVKDNRTGVDSEAFIDGYTGGRGLSENQNEELLYYTLVYAARTIKFIVNKNPQEVPLQGIADLRKVTDYVKTALQ